MSQEDHTDIPGLRLFVAAWLGVYPLVTLISWLFGATLAALPLVLRTLILTGIVVSFMLFLWMPLIHHLNHRLNRARK